MIKEEEIGYNYIKTSLEHAIDTGVKSKIDCLIRDISALKDPERLLLCLSIPADPSTNLSSSLYLSGDDFDVSSTIDGSQIYGGSGPASALHLSNQLEQSQAYTWIMSHLEEDPSTCLRKDEVFEDYRLYCERHHLKVLNTADFGKVMKRAFPNVKPRRLGQRGQSRYCYGGMRKKFEVQPPCLPDLSGEGLNNNRNNSSINSSEGSLKNGVIDPILGVSGDVLSDVASIILQYIQQVLGINFSSLYQVAQHLITNRYVNTRSKHAFSLIAHMTSHSESTSNNNERPSNPYLSSSLSLFNETLNNTTKSPIAMESKRRDKASQEMMKKIKQMKSDENCANTNISNSNGGSTGGSSSSSTPTPYPTSSSANDLNLNPTQNTDNIARKTNHESNNYSSMYNMMMAINPNNPLPPKIPVPDPNPSVTSTATSIPAQKFNSKKSGYPSDNLQSLDCTGDHWNTTNVITPRPLQPTIGAKSPYIQTHGINQFNKRDQPPSDAPGSYNPNPQIHYGNLTPSKKYRCEKNDSLNSSCQPSRYIEALGMLSPVPQSGSSVNSYLNVIESDCSPAPSNENLNIPKISKSSSIANTSRYLHSAAFTLSLDDDSCYDGDLPRLGASPGPSELFNLIDNKSDPYKSDSTCQTPVDICALNSNQNCEDREDDEMLNRTLTENDDAAARQRCGGVDTPPALSPENSRSNLLLLHPSSPTDIDKSNDLKTQNTNMIGF